MTAAATVFMLCAPGIALAQSPSVTTPPAAAAPAARTPASLAGTWVATPFETRLATDFDVSVWGPNASSVRSVELTLNAAGEGALRVTTKVVDGRRRTVAASTSVEEVRLTVGAPASPADGRTEYAVTVTKAERRYPDDPGHAWPLDGLKVRVASLGATAASPIEIRVEPPEGRGSFWETLRRRAKATRS
jgi:hypothetical protein